MVGEIANLINTGLGFLPKNRNDRLDNGTITTTLKQRELAELQAKEDKAKQTTVIIYSVIGLILLIVIAKYIIKKRRK